MSRFGGNGVEWDGMEWSGRKGQWEERGEDSVCLSGLVWGGFGCG